MFLDAVSICFDRSFSLIFGAMNSSLQAIGSGQISSSQQKCSIQAHK